MGTEKGDLNAVMVKVLLRSIYLQLIGPLLQLFLQALGLPDGVVKLLHLALQLPHLLIQVPPLLAHGSELVLGRFPVSLCLGLVLTK